MDGNEIWGLISHIVHNEDVYCTHDIYGLSPPDLFDTVFDGWHGTWSTCVWHLIGIMEGERIYRYIKDP